MENGIPFFSGISAPACHSPRSGEQREFSAWKSSGWADLLCPPQIYNLNQSSAASGKKKKSGRDSRESGQKSGKNGMIYLRGIFVHFCKIFCAFCSSLEEEKENKIPSDWEKNLPGAEIWEYSPNSGTKELHLGAWGIQSRNSKGGMRGTLGISGWWHFQIPEFVAQFGNWELGKGFGSGSLIELFPNISCWN